ncbi:response regulator [Pseudoxanthomonas sp.]|uniref:response regulator n=1 Tax=Pseudoxanthomonas sp. TaxID=1871049 RepID=UPI002584A640|nr:response regulator [Pseudoxanthomonas sp.]MCR6687661.1 response regulator [Pseudoxanthomonas sp.]
MSAPLRVLLVEDQLELRDLLADVLQDLGMDVRTADDGQSALRILESHPCDMLFSDIHMPGPTSGIDLAAHVLATRPAARVILASGHPRFQLPPLPAGAHFLQKPFRLNQFMELVRENAASPA